MKRLIHRQNIPISLIGLGILAAILLYFLPPEKRLGNIIKIVFLHGALIQTGLVAFGIAGLLGLTYLIRNSETLYRWCLATQKAAVIVWVIHTGSSIITTYFAWGVAIAWNEPRVRAVAAILGACLAFLILGLWASHRYFTAVINIVMAVAAWVLIKGAGIVRHPFNPIGSSDSVIFKWFFVAIFASTMLMAIQLTRWLHTQDQQSGTC
jgi:hypothetical protein